MISFFLLSMESLEGLFDQIKDRLLDANPGLSIFLCISKYYGKTFDYSPANISSILKQAKSDLKKLQNVSGQVQHEPTKKLEFLVLKSKLEHLIFQLEELKNFATQPVTFLDDLQNISGFYSVKSYAPIETRIKHILSTYTGVLSNLANAPQLLNRELARDHIQICLIITKSLKGFLGDSLINFVIQCSDKALVEKWSQENVKMIDALKEYENLLTTEYLPHAHDAFALGHELYSKLVKYTELVDLTPEELLVIAERDLDRNYKTLRSILDEKGDKYLDNFLNDYPDPAELFSKAEEATQRAKQFVKEKDLLSFPTDEQVEVVETPEEMKPFTFAAMNPAGIGEDSPAKESFYYVSPPDPTWDAETTQEYMHSLAYGSLEAITIHEVWPGHFQHMLFIKQLKSKILRQVAFSSTTLEGWAHYTEELAIEQEYNLIDPTKIHVGQLMWALVRNVRFISSIKMHTQGMTVEESAKLFIEKAFMSREAALKEARRGTFNPTYYNYTLGKLMIQKLREDYKKEKGKEFSLKEFHDNFVQYGTPEIYLLRQILLEKPGSAKEIL